MTVHLVLVKSYSKCERCRFVDNRPIGNNLAQQIVSSIDHVLEIDLNIADLTPKLSTKIFLHGDLLIALDVDKIPLIQTIDLCRVRVSADVRDVQDVTGYDRMVFLIQDMTTTNSDCDGLLEVQYRFRGDPMEFDVILQRDVRLKRDHTAAR